MKLPPLPQLRQMVPHDIPFVLDLFRQFGAEFQLELKMPRAQVGLDRWFDPRFTCNTVLTRDVEIVGYGSAHIRQCGERAVAYITNVLLHPEVRKRGNGYRLMIELENWCKDQGCEAVQLHCHTWNVHAAELYRDMGYALIPGTEVYYVKRFS